MRSTTLVFAVCLVCVLSAAALAAPSEVTNLRWCTGSKTCLEWDPAASATQYRVYRGERASFACLLNPSVESCDDGSFATTTTSGTMTDVPPANGLYWFLVTASNGSGEGPAGAATPSARIQNASGTCAPTCVGAGASCSVDADCCSAACIAGTCQTACCQPTAAFCTTNSDCCSGSCAGGLCQAPCTIDSQCPTGNACENPVCTAGVCGFSYVTAGTPTGSQTPGDCHQTVCDGTGGITSVVDDTDVPNDGNQCTSDVCSSGTPSNPSAPLGTGCNQNGGSVCDGVGHCVQCVSASQCPGTDTECRQRTCTNGTCGFSNTSAGTPTTSQTPGDCHQSVCDGSGNTTTVVDDTDLPNDGNQCTNDVCSSGTPSNPPAPINTSCNQNGGLVCDGVGHCVQCVSASQCPGTDTECRQRTCTASVCGFNFTSAGTVTGSQVPGNCRTNVCDGSGNIISAPDNSDVPFDGNQCTDDVCTGGIPSNPPSATGTSCNQGGGTVCNGSGSCVIPPQVISTAPVDGGSALASTTISVTFNHAMDPTSLTVQTSAGACTGNVQVSLDGFGSCIAFPAATGTMSGGNTIVTLTPTPGLLVNRAFKIRVKAAVLDNAAVPMGSDYTSTNGFTTSSPNLCDGSLVISQIYGGGGFAGATYRNDFIELHNRGTTAVSLTGFSVQYANTTGSTWSTTNLSGSIVAGGYYLIQEASDGPGGVLLPAAQATGSLNLSAAAGKVALVSNQTGLMLTCPTGGAIVDFVGYGSTTNCNEGGANAIAGTNTASVGRVQAGCADVNQNGNDFTTGTPNARNSSTTPNVCACVARNESNNASEADFCVTNFPSSLTVQAGVSTGSIFGQVYEAGVTEPAGASTLVRAQLGYGALSANPEYQSGWTWFSASYNTQVGNNDEYQGSFTAPAAGTYGYVYRFSVDQGVSWTYCDKNQDDGGAGSNAGLTFDLGNIPVMTTTP